jgi:tetratricopeptide (TPR) repeat protein/mono/diheme cytochrome c family protein
MNVFLKICGTCAAALLAGSAVASTPSSARQAESARRVTFNREIAPLLFERCAGCHHPDGTAPFSLLTYPAVRQRARLIATVTKSRLMPPWKSEPGYGEFIGQKHLSEAEIDLIERWVDSGAPEGDPRDLPPLPTWTAGWQLGTPDLVVSLPKPYAVRADGPNFSRTFILPLPISTVRYVKGIEFRPGNSAVVHHANIRITTLGSVGSSMGGSMSDSLNRTRAPGRLLFSAAYPDGYFLGWTPGQSAPLLPRGLAWRLNPGTDLVVEIHLVPTGKPEVVQFSAGLFFAEDPPERTPAMLRLGRQTIDIPAGQTDYVTTDSFVLPVDVEVLAVQPHAHYRARDVRGTATLPDGTTKPLIYIKDWDFMWQHVYRYVTPLVLPKGTSLAMRITYDNSADNPRNPQQPPARVHWGQQSTDEMGDIWVQMLTRTDRDLRILNEAIRPKLIAEDLIGYETMSRADPSRVDIHNDIAVMYDEIGRPEQAATHFEAVVKLQPDSAAAHYNFGTALATIGRPADAVDQYRQALQLKPDYALAHNNLGQSLVRLGKREEGVVQFREAARLDPTLADARYNLGTLDCAAGKMSEGIDEFRQAVRLQPDWVQAVGSLAWVLATVPSASLRNAGEAIQLAEHAAKLTDRRDAEILDVLAAAQAAAGHFDLAVTTCEAALALSPAAPLAAAISEHETLYKQGRPYVSNSG